MGPRKVIRHLSEQPKTELFLSKSLKISGFRRGSLLTTALQKAFSSIGKNRDNFSFFSFLHKGFVLWHSFLSFFTCICYKLFVLVYYRCLKTRDAQGFSLSVFLFVLFFVYCCCEPFHFALSLLMLLFVPLYADLCQS